MRNAFVSLIFLVCIGSGAAAAFEASAQSSGRCAELGIAITRAEFKRAQLRNRSAAALKINQRRFIRLSNRANQRLAHADYLVRRAAGTSYEQRARLYRERLARRTTAAISKNRRQRARLTERSTRALTRMNARIGAFASEQKSLGCSAA